jgi:hypothetical protein
MRLPVGSTQIWTTGGVLVIHVVMSREASVVCHDDDRYWQG